MKYILIGQKNVGKSSIFNRILGKKTSIVNSIPGSTRDWIENSKTKDNKIIHLIDTPGLNPLSDKLYDKDIISYIRSNITKGTIIIFVVEVNDEFNEIDTEILRIIRKFNLNIILIINKVDNKKLEMKAHNYSKFGLSNIFCTSCTHNLGFNKLNLHLFERSSLLPKSDNEIKNDDLLIGVYGKPNVGKSTFINTFLGFKRFQTGNTPGLTTDSVYQIINYKNKKIKIFDTAGIKSKNKFNNSLEIISSSLSIRNISSTAISVIVIDCINPLNRQDKRIINIIAKKGKFLIIVFNKFDLINDKKKFKTDLTNYLQNEIHQIKNLKYYFICSYKKNDVKKIFDYICFEITLENKISTSKINIWLKKAVYEYAHPLIKGKKVNFKYAIQTNTLPIKIKIYTNHPRKIIESYKRYLINSFIKYFKIKNQNIKFYFSNSKNPYIND